MIKAGRLVLDRNPENYFAEVEQAAFNPGHFVPGIGPSPDRILQARLFAYGGAQRHRIGVNHTEIPVNRPQTPVANYSRDGALRSDGNHGRQRNYGPNSFDGPVQTGEPFHVALPVQGLAQSQPAGMRIGDDDFVQAGMLYRLMGEAERQRVITRIAGSLSLVSRDDIIERSIDHFRNADAEYGDRLARAIRDRRARSGVAETARRPKVLGARVGM